MARTQEGAKGDVRSSALWGTGSRGGDHRSHRVPGRRALLGVVASLALALPLAAGADDSRKSTEATYVAPAVYQAAQQNPDAVLQVIIQSSESWQEAKEAVDDAEKTVDGVHEAADDAAKDEQKAVSEYERASQDARTAADEAAAADANARRAAKKAKAAAEREAAKAARQAERQAARAKTAEERFAAAVERASTSRRAAARLARHTLAKLDKLKLVDGITVGLPASWVQLLEEVPGLTVTLDAPVEATALSAVQLWPHQSGASLYWRGELGPEPPAIAIVDSGIERGVVGFGVAGSRVVHREVITSLAQDKTKLDGRGHGTFVAGIAAGDAPGYAGVAPTADLVDLDVMDDRGMARTSDVIKAAEWILQNKDRHNIRVANFSLHSSSVLSIRHHPLNKAVEQLWLNGVVVVAAAGNYGTADGPSGVVHAPGNDPFVITVGAYDLDGSARISNHDVPSWSAYGYTNEGFAKPDVVAAGRYLVAPAPVGATIGLDRPERIVAPGRLRLSGTSFAAPVVSGMAAQILAYKPGWTPDQVKGALMMSGRRIPDASLLQQGRGEVNLVRALGTRHAANPNAALDRFVVQSSSGSGSGTRVFDTAAFYAAVKGSSAWDAAAWQDAAWQSAAWQDAAWQDAAWQSAAWQDAAWQDAAWADSTSYEDNAGGEAGGEESLLSDEAEALLEADPELHSGTTP